MKNFQNKNLEKLQKQSSFFGKSILFVLDIVALTFIVFMVVVMLNMAPEPSFWLKFGYYFVTIYILGFTSLKLIFGKDSQPQERVSGFAVLGFCVFQLVVFESLT